MENVTSIFDLPADPANSNNNNNNNGLQLKLQETATNHPSANGNGNGNAMANASSNQSTPHPNPNHLDQNTIQQIVNTLQQASLTGATQLPSRDIPMHSGVHVQDPEARTNYVPPPRMSDRGSSNEIEDEWAAQLTKEEMVKNYNHRFKRNQRLDDFYEELHGPLLLGILFFIFQLPICKTQLFAYFPALFSVDGNYNLYGFVFTSVLFAIVYFFLQKMQVYFGNKLL
jgi:hypothetical protein